MSNEGIPPVYAIPPGPREIRPTASLIEAGTDLLADWKALRRDAAATCRMHHYASNAEAMGFDAAWFNLADPWPTLIDNKRGIDLPRCHRDSVQHFPSEPPKVAELDLHGNPMVNSAGRPLAMTMPAMRHFYVQTSPDELKRWRQLISRSSRWLWETREVSGRWIAYFQPTDAPWWSGIFELLFANECAEASAERSIPLPPEDGSSAVVCVPWDAEFVRDAISGTTKFGPQIVGIPPAWAERLPEAYLSRLDDPASASVGLVESIMDGLRRKVEADMNAEATTSQRKSMVWKDKSEVRGDVVVPQLAESTLAELVGCMTPAMRRTLEWLYRWLYEPYPHDEGPGMHDAMDIVTEFALKATAAAEGWADPSGDGSVAALVELGLVVRGESRLQDCRRWLAPNGVRMATFFEGTTPDAGLGQWQRRAEADNRVIMSGWEVKLADQPKPQRCYRLTGDGLRMAIRLRGGKPVGAMAEADKVPARESTKSHQDDDPGTIAERLEQRRAAGDAFTSQRKLAAKLDCSVSSVGKALKATDALTRWSKSNFKPPKRIDAVPLSGVVVDRLAAAPQTGEPIDDYDDNMIEAALAALLDQAKPAERAVINAKSEDEKRHLAVVHLEQVADHEPSPLDAAGRSIKVYKRA